MPVLRYRTRGLTAFDPEPCPCGRPFVRIGRIKGRSDDVLIIRVVNVFPSQIEHVLVRVPEAEPHYQLVLRREGALDTLLSRAPPGVATTPISSTYCGWITNIPPYLLSCLLLNM